MEYIQDMLPCLEFRKKMWLIKYCSSDLFTLYSKGAGAFGLVIGYFITPSLGYNSFIKDWKTVSTDFKEMGTML